MYNKIFRIWFDRGIQILLAFLPWTPFFTVFLTYTVGIPGAQFLKEWLLFIAGMLLIFIVCSESIKRGRLAIEWTWIDILIIGYIATMCIVTLFTTGIPGLIYGGRYDIAFLLIYILAYHGYPYLKHSLSYYLSIFLVSAGIMLFISWLLKYPLDEEYLQYFGYSSAVSAWQFGDAPPMYHGIDGANVRRFQGLLDGPNTMGAFILMYTGILLYYVRYKRDWYFLTGIGVLILVVMLLYTYSRSAMLALGFSVFLVFILSIKTLYIRYKTQLFVICGVIILLGSMVFIKYSWTGQAILGREGSTRGHAERMLVWVDRFLSAPLGQGMWSAWPAYRHVLGLQGETRKQIEEQDRYYIPESWYIQQYIEGGMIGGTLFMLIMGLLFVALLLLHPILGSMFAGIGLMNLFLHTFESSVIAFPLFLLIGLLLAYAKKVSA